VTLQGRPRLVRSSTQVLRTPAPVRPAMVDTVHDCEEVEPRDWLLTTMTTTWQGVVASAPDRVSIGRARPCAILSTCSPLSHGG
jgi:hypothetical protein